MQRNFLKVMIYGTSETQNRHISYRMESRSRQKAAYSQRRSSDRQDRIHTAVRAEQLRKCDRDQLC